jgi:hypothetical protein
MGCERAELALLLDRLYKVLTERCQRELDSVKCGRVLSHLASLVTALKEKEGERILSDLL